MPSVDLFPIPIPHPTTLLELRTSTLKKFGTVLSGIDKKPIQTPLYVSATGLTDDEHDLTFHGGVDKAIHQYDHGHYSFWQARHPQAAAKFVAGGFGENFVAEGLTEENICIGDLVRVGPQDSTINEDGSGCLLEVSLPRQPCFKLNQRFSIKNFAPQTHQEDKTGWYYRVVKQGYISAGMELRVVERQNPTWSIARLQHFFHRGKNDLKIARELSELPELGDECRDVFKKRILEAETKATRKVAQWTDYTVTSRTLETPRIVRLELTLTDPSGVVSTPLPAGSYTLLTLPNGLQRNYSVVTGTTSSFTLGIALDDKSRGGSSYIHNDLTVDTIIQTFELHYAVRSAEDVAFRSLMIEFMDSVHVYDKQEGQRMDINKILRNKATDSHVFICGPERMISSVITAAKESGMAEDEVFYETFSTNTAGDPFTVDVVTANKATKLTVEAEKTLLETMRAAGLEVASSCETGSCGTCRIGVKEGKVLHRGKGLTAEEQEKEMLCCVSRGEGHIVVELDI